MLIFLTVYFFIYSAIHTFCYFRLRVLLPDLPWVRIMIIFFMVCMIISPVVTRFLDHNEYDGLARITALVGFTWMGLILFLFWGTLALTFADLLFRLVNSVLPFSLPLLSGRLPCAILIGLVISFTLYGTWESWQVKIERIKISTLKLPGHVNRLRIAQISDIHLGLLARKGRLNSILQKVKQTNPDILVSTGDMLDGNVRHLPELAELLHQVPTPFGKYAVTGNHEFYTGIENAIDFHQKAGFKLLSGEIKTIPGLINIVGVDDSPAILSKPADLLLSSAPKGLFTLFLKHRPDIEEKALGHFDLQLSGHTHGGQIFLYNFLVSRSYSYMRGLFELPRGSLLYVNRGSGTWGPQMRLFTPPEITLIELVPKPVAQ